MPAPVNIKRKIKKYSEIAPNHRMTFEMLYHHAGRALCRLEEQIELEPRRKPPHRIRHTINRLQHKLEQMAAKSKSLPASGLKSFMLIAKDGRTFDNAGKEIENCQVLDFIEAADIYAAQKIFSSKTYGDFEDLFIVEYKNCK